MSGQIAPIEHPPTDTPESAVLIQLLPYDPYELYAQANAIIEAGGGATNDLELVTAVFVLAQQRGIPLIAYRTDIGLSGERYWVSYDARRLEIALQDRIEIRPKPKVEDPDVSV
jgi:hypothetical protein